MIHYSKSNYNCAHHAVKRLNAIHGSSIEFSSGDEWQVSFIELLRSKMDRINKPVNGCLVVMSQVFGGLHVGIYNDFHVEHNFSDGQTGCVIIDHIGTIRSEYKRVRFYAPH